MRQSPSRTGNKRSPFTAVVALLGLVGVVALGVFLLSGAGLSLAGLATPTGSVAQDIQPLAPGSGPVNIVFTTSPSVGVGDTFDIVIQIQAGSQQTISASTYIDFDPTLIMINSFTAGSTFPFPLTAPGTEIDNVNGEFDFAAGDLFAPFPTGTFTFATLNITALAAGTATLDFVFDTLALRETDAQGPAVSGTGATSVLNDAFDGTITIIGAATATSTSTNTATVAAPTATSTSTNTATVAPATATNTSTNTATVAAPTATNTSTNTATVAPATATNTSTNTATVAPATATNTSTATATVQAATATNTSTATATVQAATATNTSTATATVQAATATNTSTATASSVPPTATNTSTATATVQAATATNTSTATATNFVPNTNTPSPTASMTSAPPTSTNTSAPSTSTATSTQTATIAPPTNTATAGPSPTASNTLDPSLPTLAPPTGTPVPLAFVICDNLSERTGGEMTAGGSNGIAVVRTTDGTLRVSAAAARAKLAQQEVGNAYCRPIAINDTFVTSSEEIGDPGVLSMPVSNAVDIFGLLEDGTPANTFIQVMQICFRTEQGSLLLFASSKGVPRSYFPLTSYTSGDYTCAFIGEGGTVVQIDN